MTAPVLRTSHGSSNRICLLYNSFAWREAFGGSGVGCLFGGPCWLLGRCRDRVRCSRVMITVLSRECDRICLFCFQFLLLSSFAAPVCSTYPGVEGANQPMDVGGCGSAETALRLISSHTPQSQPFLSLAVLP